MRFHVGDYVQEQNKPFRLDWFYNDQLVDGQVGKLDFAIH